MYATLENYLNYIKVSGLGDFEESDLTDSMVWDFINWLKSNYYQEFHNLMSCIDFTQHLDEMVEVDEPNAAALNEIKIDFDRQILDYFSDHLLEQIEISNLEPCDYE
jgi:hypothetical protein